MKCPVCNNDMTEMRVGEILVDVCQDGCGGIWFDWNELEKVDEPHESAGENLLHVQRDQDLVIDVDKRRNCPCCENVVMTRHFSSVKRQIEVDECPKCDGFWLDHGELNRLRDQFDTEDERLEAAQAFFTDLFEEGLEDIQAESEENVERGRRVSQIFRFLCPSYYIPGKQTWGAY